MKDTYIEDFEAWWVKTTFEAFGAWSRDGERKFLPCSPRKLARAAWNAAWHHANRRINAAARQMQAATEANLRRVRARLEQAMDEIDVLERRVPMPDSEFQARMLVATNARLVHELRNLRKRLDEKHGHQGPQEGKDE